MSNFFCEKCGKAILDTPNGYMTGCKHYPLEEKNILSPNMKGRISHEKLEEIKAEKSMKRDKYKEITGIIRKHALMLFCLYGVEEELIKENEQGLNAFVYLLYDEILSELDK